MPLRDLTDFTAFPKLPQRKVNARDTAAPSLCSAIRLRIVT
jgi:hypothetical protein